MSTGTDLSIVIVNWNSREPLRDCLESLRMAASGLLIQTIVVDNGSQDGSSRMVHQEFPEIVCIDHPENSGFAKGCNIGWKHVSPSARHVLFLNPDTVVQPDALRGMVSWLDTHPNIGAVTCTLTDSEGQFQEGQGHRVPGVWTTFNQYVFVNRLLGDGLFPGVYWSHPPRRPCAVEWISGAVFLVRRQAIPSQGLFDESYFLYAEDLEASLMLRRRGWPLWYLPQYRIIHHVKRSTRQSGPDIFRMQVTNQLVYLQRHTSLARVRIISAIMFAGYLLRFCLFSLLRWGKRREQATEKATFYRRHMESLLSARKA